MVLNSQVVRTREESKKKEPMRTITVKAVYELSDLELEDKFSVTSCYQEYDYS